MRERYSEEWRGELEHWPGDLSKLWFAIGTWRGARRMAIEYAKADATRIMNLKMAEELAIEITDLIVAAAEFDQTCRNLRATVDESRAPIKEMIAAEKFDASFLNDFEIGVHRSWETMQLQRGRSTTLVDTLKEGGSEATCEAITQTIPATTDELKLEVADLFRVRDRAVQESEKLRRLLSQP